MSRTGTMRLLPSTMRPSPVRSMKYKNSLRHQGLDRYTGERMGRSSAELSMACFRRSESTCPVLRPSLSRKTFRVCPVRAR